MRVFILLLSFYLVGCNSDNSQTTTPPVLIPPPTTPINTELVAFAPNGIPEADITWTTFGVPHIKANNLQGLALGSGYAQAQDNLCVLADNFVKANSQRSQFFGPHAAVDPITGEVLIPDNANLISDFGYKALKIREQANLAFPTLSENAQALLLGFIQGYNLYLSHLDAGTVINRQFCVNQPWLRPIVPEDLLAYLYTVSMVAGATNFFDLIFFANPGQGDEYLPRLVTGQPSTLATEVSIEAFNEQLDQRMQQMRLPEVNRHELGSNAWALGQDKTVHGRGMLLANPHFPHTGNFRFWQSHLTIPGVYDVAGGSLVGMPGVVNIGFTEHHAWSHTFSTAEHFLIYQLAPHNDLLHYKVDNDTLNIHKETLAILAKIDGRIVPLEKEVYFSAHGPMLEAPPTAAPLPWNEHAAFTIQDVNQTNADEIDFWLALNVAESFSTFKQAFIDYDGAIFNNTLYSDRDGQTFYVDDSTVPGLSDQAKTLLATDPTLVATRQQFGFTLVPGNTTLFHFSGAEPFVNAPQLMRSDFVQNSNDSFWSTNLMAPLTGYSPLYGNVEAELSLRSRMGQTLLLEGAGSDQKFTLDELEAALLSNRSYLAEQVLPHLIEQCTQAPSLLVSLTESITVDIQDACTALTQWNGGQHNNSVAGALIREFAALFSTKQHFSVPFAVDDPINTPNSLVDDGSALQLLARATANLQQAGFSPMATLGEVQFVEKSDEQGQIATTRLPWPGSHNIEGGFNVFSTRLTADDTLVPKHQYPLIHDVLTNEPLTSGLSEQGYLVRYGSSWMMLVEFTEQGPQAKGLLTYSQSSDIASEHFHDQSVWYAQTRRLRPIVFTPEDIAANTLRHIAIHP